MFEDIRQFFRENPRMYAVTAAGVLVLILVVWGVYGGFSLDFSRFFASGPLPNGVLCFNDAECSSGYCRPFGPIQPVPQGRCANRSTSTNPTPTPTRTPTPTPTATSAPAGDSGSSCGPSVPEGGTFNWSFRTSEPWDDCVEGKSNATASTYWTQVSVGTCHPDDLHLVWRAEHRNKSTCDIALAGNGINEGAGITTDNGNFDDANNLPNGTAGVARMNYDPSKFNCGSVRLWGSFWASGPESNGKNAGNTGYYKVINYGKDCGAASPTRTPTPTPTSSPTRTPTPTPTGNVTPTPTGTPVPGALSCSPVQQVVAVGQTATVQASGGSGGYVWNASGGGQQIEGSGLRATYRWIVAGTKTVTVRSGSAEAFCTVVVGTGGPSALPAAFTVSKAVRNIDLSQRGFHDTADISTGQTVEFQININNTSSGDLGTMTVRDTMPSGMEFVEGSVSVEGRAVAGTGIIGSGIQVAVPYRGFITVKWSAIASRMGNLSSGPHQESPEAFVNAANGQSLTARVLLTLNGTGTETIASGPGYATIPTGPADALLFALVAAAAAALLYAGYTRTEIFRRHEAVQLGKDQGPLDFRG